MSVAHSRADMGMMARRATPRKSRNRSRDRDGLRIRPGKALVSAFWVSLAALFFAAASVGLVFVFRFLTTSAFFSLTGIEVQGAERLTVAEVSELSGARLGDNVLDLSVDEIKDRLGAHAWIASASVRRVLPGGLSIVVRERRPVWWVQRPEGLFYADVRGRAIAPVDTDRFESLPVLEIEPGADAPRPGGNLAESLAGSMADLDALGLPLRRADAAWVRLGPGDMVAMAFDKMSLDLSVDPAGLGWRESLDRLARVWRDLERRGELGALRGLKVAGGKVWVRLDGVAGKQG